MTGSAWYRGLYDEPGLRRSIVVWLMFGVPSVILSRLNWLESALWWLVLGIVSLFIAGVTVGIVLVTSRIGPRDPALLPARRPDDGPERGRYERSAGTALVASMATWAIAWLLILSTLVPEHVVRHSVLDASRGLIGLATFAIAVLMICGTIGAAFGSSAYGVSGASWAWNRLTGQDSLGTTLGGSIGLVLVVIFAVAAITGWLWLLSQALRLALLYAGWSR